MALDDGEARILVWCGGEWALLTSGTNVIALSLAGEQETWSLEEDPRVVACIPPG